MITPGDLPVVLGGGGVGHLWIGADYQTDLTDFQLRRVERKKSLKVMGSKVYGGGAVLAVPPNGVNVTASGTEVLLTCCLKRTTITSGNGAQFRGFQKE